MKEPIHADGDTWRVADTGHDPRRAVHTVVFHCLSDNQRPYRVLEVPESQLGARSFDTLSEAELVGLFSRSHTMDYSHDEAAEPASHGYGGRPLGRGGPPPG
ncbi:MAG: hypothetical protein WD054_03375 [Gemmatimonadota bacterium]